MSQNLVLITGCSGGGKSTLIDALSARGHLTVAEPGRRIVAEELKGDGKALPWVDLHAFANKAVDMARKDLNEFRASNELVFFDRGLIDAALALDFAGGNPLNVTLDNEKSYAQNVFLVPPWAEIYVKDNARQHDFNTALDEYYRIKDALEDLQYDICLLPKIGVDQRVEFVLRNLERNK
ncbi:MAG: AAA family ATPase [Rhizobiaceae bacterium]|nr:AAA family ATPase [Rhizobiaceae bacterium]